MEGVSFSEDALLNLREVPSNVSKLVLALSSKICCPPVAAFGVTSDFDRISKVVVIRYRVRISNDRLKDSK